MDWRITCGTSKHKRKHWGGAVTFGLGIFHWKLPEKNLNTKIKTELEVVRMSEYTPYNIYIIDLF